MSTSRSSSKDATMTHAIQRPVKGVLGEKLGMTQVWDAENRLVPVTVIKAGPCVVTHVRNADADGYDAVQIAFGAIDPRKVNKPMTGHFEKAGVTPRRHLAEIRTSEASSYDLGQELTATTSTVSALRTGRTRTIASRVRSGPAPLLGACSRA